MYQNAINETVEQVKSMMDRTLAEFIYEMCDSQTLEKIRYSMLHRFNEDFIYTSKLEFGTLSVEVTNVGRRGVKAVFSIWFLFPYRHHEWVVSTAYC